MKNVIKYIYIYITNRKTRLKNEKQNIYIHPNSHIGKGTTIGKGTRINGPAYIVSSHKSKVIIGKYCAIAHNLRIRARNHYIGYPNVQDTFQKKYNFPSLDNIKGPVEIGNAVWIGDNVIILSGVKVGNGAVIGAGSIVTKDIPSYSVAVGNPARVIKKRFNDHIINQLENIKWWDWSEYKIQINKSFFSTDLSINSNINLDDIIN